mgnify:CR=1 FL=1
MIDLEKEVKEIKKIYKDNNYDNEPCGIDYSYIVDTLNQDYDTVNIDTIYKVDSTGKLYKDIIIK